MPLSIDEAITQLDHGWLCHLKSQGYGGDALRQAIDLVLYAQQQAAARNSAELKAGMARINRLLGLRIVCDNNGDYQYTAEWHDPACPELGWAIEYAADPASWRAEFRMPGCWPHTYDNLDITDTRAVDHDVALWLARVATRHAAHLLARELAEGEELALQCRSGVRATDWAAFEQGHARQPSACTVDGREVRARWQARYPARAQRDLQRDFDLTAALLLHLTAVQQAAGQGMASGRLQEKQSMYRPAADVGRTRSH